MIYPTIGRVVWIQTGQLQPQAGVVTWVHNESMINVVAFDRTGASRGVQGLHLKQDDAEKPPLPYAEWMPYQKGQAEKHKG